MSNSKNHYRSEKKMLDVEYLKNTQRIKGISFQLFFLIVSVDITLGQAASSHSTPFHFSMD